MAVKASVTITITKYRDTDSITRYYKLQASTAAAPAVPTTLTPSGWSTSEPTYTSGSTNTLYYTDCIIFSDGTFQYTDDGNGKAVKSSSYEAAKEAYNKAQAAQNSITDYINKKDIIVGTQTASTRFWTGNSQLESLQDGDEILYWLPYGGKAEAASSDKVVGVDMRVNSTTTKTAGTLISSFENSSVSNAWLNLTLKDRTTQTGWIPLYYGGTTRMTTHYGSGNCIRLIYRVNANIAGVQYTGWFADANYVGNDTYDRIRFNNAIKAKTAISASRLIVGDDSGYFHLLAGVTFKLDKPILWANAAIAANATGTDNYLSKPSLTMRNNTNSSWTATQYKTLYLVGILNGDTFTVDSTTPFTTTIPTTEDGKYYISLGYMYSTYQIYLYPEHPIFKYINGQFKNIAQIAYEAKIDIDNLEIGGRNLLQNSSGNLGDKSKWSNSVTWMTIYQEGGYLNRPYFNFTKDLSESSSRTFLNNTNGPFSKEEYRNKEFTISGYVRNNLETPSTVQIFIRENSGEITTVSETIIIPANSGWIRFEFTGRTGNFVVADGYPLFQLAFKQGENHNTDFCMLKVELGNKATDWTPAPEDVETQIDNVNTDLTYFKETTFTTYQRQQELNDQGIKNRLSRTEVTVYGDPENPDDPEALINHIQKVDNDINGSGGLDDRLEAAEGTIDGTGLNDYDQRVKITQRFLNVETDVESIKNIFKITGGTNLVQNSVGYFADNDNKPTMWSIAANTIYTPFGYDGDLTGITVSRGRLFCAKGSVTTTPNNIVALLANKMMSISFKYKNGANAQSTIKIFNGSVVYFEKTFTSAVNQWTEYTFNPDTDPVLANPSFLNTANSLQISITSTNSTNSNGFEISDLMLNYGDIKPWELSSNEVYGAMVKLSSLGIEVTATTAKTKNFMTTDGILVYEYNPQTETIGNLITKITDEGTETNKLISTGDIIERNLVHTMIKDSSNNNVYVEYIK